MDDNDGDTRVGLWVVFGIVTLLLVGLIAALAIRATLASKAPAVAAAAAPVATVVADVLIEGPLSGELVGKLVFEVAKAELPADATAALAPVLQALAANPGKKLVVAGFLDPSGDAVINLELAKNRARAVRAAITSQGVDAARVALRKPGQAAAGGAADGAADDARRVEIRLVD